VQSKLWRLTFDLYGSVVLIPYALNVACGDVGCPAGSGLRVNSACGDGDCPTGFRLSGSEVWGNQIRLAFEFYWCKSCWDCR
jgi:hypothetical protein